MLLCPTCHKVLHSESKFCSECGAKVPDKPILPMPEPILQPDFERLISMVKDGIAAAKQNGYLDKNFRGYIYEEVLESIYGKEFWPWLRQQNW